MSMTTIKLLLDEDVWVGLAPALQQVGYDVLTVTEAGRKGLSDEAQLQFAIAESRAIITHNIQDFVPLARHYFEQELFHYGIIITPHIAKGTLLQRTLTLLNSLTVDQLANTVRFV